jgi:hypothetical protein
MKTPELTRIPGQGEPRTAKEEMLRTIVSGLDTCRSEAASEIWTRRRWADDVRYCIWNGQSDDGRKRDDALGDNGPAFPFDGASDSRVRLADFVLRVQVALLKQAVKRASITVREVESGDVNVAGHLSTLAKWLLNNRIARNWRMHIERLAQWGLGDSPAISLLHVYQDVREVVRMRRYTIDELIMWLEEMAIDPMSPLGEMELGDLLMNPARQEELVMQLSQQFPQLKPAVLRKSLKTLLEQGVADFPVVEVLHNEPRIEALRMWEDVFVPTDTRDPETCQVIYVRRWMTLAQLEEKERMEGWDAEAIDKLTGRDEDASKGQEGASYILEADGRETTEVRVFDHTFGRDGLYEVITAYIRGVTDDGVTGIFTIHFSGFVDEPLSQMKLLNYPHAGFPFVWYVREYTSCCLLDSRGMCELLQTDQDFLKVMRDLNADHAQLFTLPPFIHNMTSPEREVRFTSLALIRVGTNSTLDPIKIPQGSELPLKHMEALYRQVSNYTGVAITDINEVVQSILTQDMVDDFIDVIRDAILMLMQLAVTFMDEQELRDICNAPELDMEDLRMGMRKLRDIHVEFNAATLNVDFIKALSDVVSSIRQHDTEKTIMDGELVDYMMRQLSPTLANRAVRPVEVARAAEVEDEKKNLALIMSGQEPAMVEKGQNYQARLDYLMKWLQLQQQAAQNGIMPPLPPMVMQVLEARVKHLEGQMMQQENAVTGRTMAEKALPL